jgi:hypothetical protein
VGNVSSTEIAALEQSLIDEGMAPEEIQKFCNVHVLLFESSLAQPAAASPTEGEVPALHLFKRENREIERRVAALRQAAADPGLQPALPKLLGELSGVETHYARKEQVLFPYLERHGFVGPSKVMWGKHDEVRRLLRKARQELERGGGKLPAGFVRDHLEPLLAEVEGMITKEETVLFPTSQEKLSAAEWEAVLKEGAEVGYAFIQAPKAAGEPGAAGGAAPQAVQGPQGPQSGEGVRLPSGVFSLAELTGLLNTLPVDITFIDAQDKVKYFSEGKERIFARPRSVIGRAVQNCHPPQSVASVEKILRSFKDGSRDVAEFWINFQGRFVHIRYFAVRDPEGKYLGTLEVSQDLGPLRALQGEKRLLDDR